MLDIFLYYLEPSIVNSSFFQYLPPFFGYLIVLSTIIWGIYTLKTRETFSKNEIITLTIVILVYTLLAFNQPFTTGAGGGEEYNYVLVGESISETFTFTNARADGGIYLKPYVMYPVLVSIPSLFFETSLSLGISVNTVLSVLTLFMFYLVSKSFFGEKAGIFSVIILGISPLFLKMARSPESLMVSGFYLLFTVYGMQKWEESPQIGYKIGIIIGVLGMVFSRTDMWLFIPPLFITYLLKTKKIKEKIFSKQNILLGLVFMAVSTVSLMLNINFGTSLARPFSTENLLNNLTEFFFTVRSSFGYVLILLIGLPLSLYYLMTEKGKRVIYGIGLLNLVFYLFYQPGNINAHPKFYFITLIIFSFSIGDFFYKISNKYNKKRFYKPFILFTILIIIAIPTGYNIQQIERDEYSLAAKHTLNIPMRMYPECTLLAQDRRHVKIVGYEEAISSWSYSKEELGEINKLREFNEECLIYYRRRKDASHFEKFEQKFLEEAEKLSTYPTDNLYDPTAYLINLTEPGQTN